MVKKAFLALMLVVVVIGFSGCAAGGGNIFEDAWKHIQWHILGAYKDLVNIHEEIDKYVFNLDVRDPDRY